MRNEKFNRPLRALTVFAFLIGAAFFNQTFAQGAEAQVAKIRALANNTNREIEAGLEDNSSGLHHAAITVGGNKDGQQWRAVGNRNQTTEFYFNCEPDDPECGTDARQFVVKIVGTYQSGSSITSRFEYLFDDKGELVFAYTIEADDNNKPFERRFYYADKKLIRVTRGGKNYDANFSKSDLEAATAAKTSARDFKNLFTIIL